MGELNSLIGVFGNISCNNITVGSSKVAIGSSSGKYNQDEN